MTAETKAPREGESFFARFHRLKTEARQPVPNEPPSVEQVQAEQPLAAVTEAAEPPAEAVDVKPPEPTDEDMPPLDTLTPDSDYTGFLSAKVSDALRKAALRKLFHGEEFNVVDGLDEYAEDYTTFETLGDIVTSDMRHQLEEAAKRKAEELQEQLLEPEANDKETLTTDVETELEASGDAVPPAATPQPASETELSTADTPHHE